MDPSISTISLFGGAVSRLPPLSLVAWRARSQSEREFLLDTVNDNSGTPACTACSAEEEA